MPFVRTNDGQVVEVGADAIFTDATAQTPLNIPTGPVFTAEDIENARRQEKDKLYSQLERNNQELTALREQVGTLTEAEQRRQAELEAEQQRLQEEQRRQEEQGLDPQTLVERARQEWEQRLEQTNKTWEQKFEEERQQRAAAEAIAAKEREFNDLREYAQGQIAAHEGQIAPQFLPFIEGNSQAEIDAKIAQAVTATDAIAEEMRQAFGGQQQVQDPSQQQQFAVVPGAQPTPPVTPGVRATGGPANADPAAGQQQLTPEQIANMPMDKYAEFRRTMGIGGQSNARGLFG